jgi:hypothetical protein
MTLKLRGNIRLVEKNKLKETHYRNVDVRRVIEGQYPFYGAIFPFDAYIYNATDGSDIC